MQKTITEKNAITIKINKTVINFPARDEELQVNLNKLLRN